MPRYIDADFIKTGLKQEFCTACSGDYENNRQCCAACDIAYTMNLIDETPTADVEPVRHGRWYEYGEQSYKRCSICHERYSAPLGVFPPFCLNCGAKMDKEVEE